MSSVIQKSMASGEMSPYLYARTDTAKYQNGLRTLRNGFVLRHGGSANRPGTGFIGEVKDSTSTVRLVRFVVSNSLAYVLEFGNQYMRVIKNGAYVVAAAAQSITAITNANPCVLSYSGADTFANGDEVQVTGIVGPIGQYLNVRNFRVASVNTAANTFQLLNLDGTPVNSTAFGAYTSGGTVAKVFELATPYTIADVPNFQFVQSADVMTIVHPSYEIRELSRTADNAWSIGTISLKPVIQPPTVSTTGGGVTFYYITAISAETGEESLSSNLFDSAVATPSTGTPVTIQMGQPATGPKAASYNVYRQLNGGVYFIGNVADSGTAVTKFIDTGIPPDVTAAIPKDPQLYQAVDKYPSVVGIVQQRRAFAAPNENTEEIRLSRAGSYRNFINSSPIQDDDPIKFSLAGQEVNSIRHVMEIAGAPVLFTQSSEWTLQGDNGTLTPFAINPKSGSANGCSKLPPLPIDSTALYVQAMGSAIRDLNFDFQVDGYRGNEVSIFSSHLVDNFTLIDWAYQKIPHSMVWMVRNDGVLLSLTYNREQQILGWGRHDFDGGTVENVCAIPEGNEYRVYVVVKRTVNGRSVRYVERMATRVVTDIKDCKFMDAFLTYDGRNTGPTTMTLSGGTTWDYTENLTLTASASTFTADDVGTQIHLKDATGAIIRFSINAYTSPTVVTGSPNKTVPASLQTATTNWARAVKSVLGLWHLEGKQVSVLGDGYVVASPYNSSNDTITVASGKITLDKCYSVIQVGLPYISDVGTLDIDTANGESVADRKLAVTRVTARMDKSAGMFYGMTEPTGTDPLQGLTEMKPKLKSTLDDSIQLFSGKKTINMNANWDFNGRVFIRQIDPLPMSILSLAPAGFIPLPQGS